MPHAVTRVLFVCHANLCRSPLAHAILVQRASEAGLSPRFEVDSAGTWAEQGQAPHPRSVAVARARGIDLACAGTSRGMLPDDLERFDHVLVMDRAIHADVLRLRRLSAFGPVEVPTQGRTPEIRLVRHLEDPRLRGAASEIVDPLGRPAEVFDQVFEQLDAACRALLGECTGSPQATHGTGDATA